MSPKPLPPLADVLRAREQSLRVSQARCVSEVPGPRGEAQAMAYGFEAEEIRINLLPLAQEYDAELALLREAAENLTTAIGTIASQQAELARLRAENAELRASADRASAALATLLMEKYGSPEAREAMDRNIREAAP